MTCILAVKHENRVHVLADQSVTSGWQKMKGHTKISQHDTPAGTIIMATSGDTRISQLIDFFELEPPDPGYVLPRHYIIKRLIPALQAHLEANKASMEESAILIAIQDYWGIICTDYSLITEGDYGGVGVASDVGLGALGALYPTLTDPEKALRQAMAIAESHYLAVSGPYDYAHT